MDVREAETIMEEEKSWYCQDCGTMIEEEQGPHCRLCASYWDDVQNGLFSDDW